jgi:hypothetical protein
MSDSEIRMMHYTIEQLSAELQAIRQYVSDITPKLERTRKELEIAIDALKSAQQYICSDKKSYQIIQTAIEQITALEQKD